MSDEPVHYYRYIDTYQTDWTNRYNMYYEWETWTLIKKTPRGAWVERYGTKKFILDGDGKRYAYRNRVDALRSYRIRKLWAIKWAEHRLKAAKTGLAHVDEILQLEDVLNPKD